MQESGVWPYSTLMIEIYFSVICFVSRNSGISLVLLARRSCQQPDMWADDLLTQNSVII